MSQDPPEQPSGDDGQAPPPPGQPSGDYGQAPPPPSAYPSPAQGGFQPPPPPGPDAYGNYAAPGPGYGRTAGGSPEPQATESLSRGWRAFTANPWPFVISQILWALIIIVPVAVLLAAFGVFSAPSINADGSASAGLAALIGIGGLVVVLVAVLLGVVQIGAFATAALRAVAGERVTLADFFRPRNLTQLLLLALLLGVASGLVAITGIGPLIVMFFGIWSVFFVVDRGQSAIEAITSSVRFAMANAGQTIVLVLLGYLLNFVGGLLCGIGTLITNPVTMLAFADYYRRITGPATPGQRLAG